MPKNSLHNDTLKHFWGFNKKKGLSLLSFFMLLWWTIFLTNNLVQNISLCTDDLD